MENKIVISNLLHRPIRTAVSVLAVAIEVGMVMLVVGMTSGLVNESAKRVKGVGADLMVQPPSSSMFLALSSSPMPIKIGDHLRELPHVLAVAPVLVQFNSVGGINQIWGIEMESFNRVTGGFVYHGASGPLKNPYDILVDDVYAKANHSGVGKKITLFDHDFTIAGIVEHGKGTRLFIPLATSQELTSSPNTASIFFVKCTDPGYTDDVIESIRQFLPKYKVLSITEFMSLFTTNNLPGLTAFITSLVGVAVGIGFLVIFLSMYTTITERTREIGILKSLGASKVYIIEGILRESTILCLIGILAGYGGTLLARKILLSAFPTLTVELTVIWAFYAALLALAGSAFGAFYPALRAASLDPVDALAYE
jgi:putative ABC transport system permease protein